MRRTKSKFGARLERMVVDLQCYEGRNLDTVTQAVTIHPYGEQIARDYRAYTVLSTILETADRVAEERLPMLQQYLPPQRLASLAGGAHDASLVLDAYLLRALAVAAGAELDSSPAVATRVRHLAFSVAGGGAVCPLCRTPGCAAPARATMELLAALRRRLGHCGRQPPPAPAGGGAGLPRHTGSSGIYGAQVAATRRARAPCRDASRQSGSLTLGTTPMIPPFPHPSGAQPPYSRAGDLPKHVAIVMDGNGRWANHSALPRTKGHEAGEGRAARRRRRRDRGGRDAPVRLCVLDENSAVPTRSAS